jgi:heme A synthase
VARFALLLGAYLSWLGLAWAVVSFRAFSSTTISSGTGRATVVTQSSSTLYQNQPTTVRAILIGLAVVLVISTASVVWRVVRRSRRLGVSGMVVAALVGAVALLGILTIGLFIVPLAALLVVLALPIAAEAKVAHLAQGAVSPGWYRDPERSDTWRYWDGESWTAHTAPMVAPG